MSCESYQSALTETAAGAPASPALRAHLVVCADCRSALSAEEALFASIDRGLRCVANTEVPASLIPSVRALLAERTPSRFSWSSVWALSGAALVTAIVVASVMRIPKPPADPGKSAPQVTANAAAASMPGAVPATNAPGNSRPIRAVKPVLTAISLANTQAPLANAPLVLVPPDEREAFARFLSTVETRPALVASLVQTKQPEAEKPVTADAIVIAALDVKPLEGSAESGESKEK